MIVLVDIDGTLTRDFQWGMTWDDVDTQTPNIPVISVVQGLAMQGHIIVVMSFRPEFTRRATVAWLDKWHVPFKNLLLRRDDDRRSAPEVKREMVQKVKDMGLGHEVSLALEDDPRNAEMFRDEGIQTMMVLQPATI